MIDIQSFDAAEADYYPQITEILKGPNRTQESAIDRAHFVISKIYKYFVRNSHELEDLRAFQKTPDPNILANLIEEILNQEIAEHKFYEINAVTKAAMMKVCVSCLPESLISKNSTAEIQKINWNNSDVNVIKYEITKIMRTLPTKNFEILIFWIQIVQQLAKSQLRVKALKGDALAKFLQPSGFADLFPFNIFHGELVSHCNIQLNFLLEKPISVLFQDTGCFVAKYADPNVKKICEFEEVLVKILLALKDIVKANVNKRKLRNLFCCDKLSEAANKMCRKILQRKISDMDLENFSCDLAGEIMKSLLQLSPRAVFSFPQNLDILTALRGRVNKRGYWMGSPLTDGEKTSAVATICYSLGTTRHFIVKVVISAIIYVEKVNGQIIGESRHKLKTYGNIFARLLFQYDRGEPFLTFLKKRWAANHFKDYNKIRSQLLKEFTIIYSEAILRLIKVSQENIYEVMDLSLFKFYRTEEIELPPMANEIYSCITQKQWDWLESF